MRGDDDDGAATRVWLGPNDEPIELPPNRLKWIALGVLVGIAGVVTLAIVVFSSRSQQGTVPGQPAATTTDHSRPPTEREVVLPPWVPPSGPSRSLELSAVGFPSFNEDDLGTLFDAKLRQLERRPNLYARHSVVRVPRNEFTHMFARVTSQLELGIVITAILGGSYRRDRFYAMYRALEIKTVVKVDDRAPMIEPPPAAAYYLAELQVGSSYDVVIEGASRDMGARLDRELTRGALELSVGSSSSSYRAQRKGLGLRPRSGDAIFANTSEDVAAAYTTEGAAVPVRLVFRQIPGRKLPPDTIKWPTPFIDETFTLDDGKQRRFHVPAGLYSVSVVTRPNGVVVDWGGADCKSGNYSQLSTVCKLTTHTTLTIENWMGLFKGPDETITLSIQKGRDPSAIESSSPGR